MCSVKIRMNAQGPGQEKTEVFLNRRKASMAGYTDVG